MKTVKSKILASICLFFLFCTVVLSTPVQDMLIILIGLDRQLLKPATVWQPTVSEHPFGKPAIGSLPWEDDPKFQASLKKQQVTTRMAAFETTLPDPLPGEDWNFARAADLLRGTVLPADAVFSMNKTVGPYSLERGYREGPVYFGNHILRGVGGGVCKMATTLYNAAILADLPIVSRKNHSMLVPYANPGQDATVSYGKVDLQFMNDTDGSILIWADTKGATLYVAFYGQRESPQVTWHHEIIYLQERPVVRKLNPALPAGERRVTIAGAEGIAVKSWVIVRYKNGEEVKKPLGIDWYRPMPRVIEHGP